jgi:uncharacterized protein YbjT (DUF2867 family)
MSKPLILITGATGTIGSHLVPQLVARGARVRTLVRDPKKAIALGSGFEVFVGDLAKPETLPPALKGVDKLFVISNGSNIAELEGNILDAARNSAVRHIVKISGRHLDASFMTDAPLAINQNAAETHLKSLGVDWTIIRPGMFASNFLLWIDHSQGIVPLPVGDGRDTPTDPADIAAVGCETLIGSNHEGKIYEITGPEFLTFHDMTARIASAIDQPLEMVDVPPEVAYQGMISSGVPDTQAQGIIRYFEAVRKGQVYPPTDTIKRLLGRQPRRFDDWVTGHLRELRG